MTPSAKTRAPEDPTPRPSGYVSRSEELFYGLRHPLYDLVTWWCFLPLGGEIFVRRQFVAWLELDPDSRLLSLCCGTGSTERAVAEAFPGVRMLGIDLGVGQLARARRKVGSEHFELRLGDASRTELPAASFDRVLICLALHEMPHSLRLAVLREARRVCRPAGRVIAIEHARPRSLRSRALRSLCWGTWLPGNPERRTTLDLQRRGLDQELQEAGLRVTARHVTRFEWIEGLLAAPVSSPAGAETAEHRRALPTSVVH